MAVAILALVVVRTIDTGTAVVVVQTASKIASETASGTEELSIDIWVAQPTFQDSQSCLQTGPRFSLSPQGTALAGRPLQLCPVFPSRAASKPESSSELLYRSVT